jgi:TldD protein
MATIRRRELLALLAASGKVFAQPETPILKAMIEEMERTRNLRLMGLGPYFVEYGVEDQEATSISASLGGLLNARQNRIRMPIVTIRVGSYEMDQTNQIFAGIYSGTRYDSDYLTLDDNVALMRQTLWLATDRAFKSAVEAMSAKQQILRVANVTETLPDNQKAPPVVKVTNAVRNKVDVEAWKARAVRVSKVFTAFPEVLASAAEFDALASISHHVNTEGTRVRLPDYLTTMRIRAAGQAADGSVLRDSVVFHAFEDTRMAAVEEMERAAREVGANVKALVAAPGGENYSGPVLFEPRAAAQLFGQLLGDNLRNSRRPLADPGRQVPFQPSELDGKIGSRVLPEMFDVVDDATVKTFEGHTMMGHYEIDTEAVAPRPVTVIDKGVLKEYLRTRQPIKGFSGSTGHARLAGNFGHRTAAISNLFVKARESKPLAELKKQLIEMCQQRSKPYGMLIRKLDYPSSASVTELQAMFASYSQSGSTTRPVPPLLLAYRVYPDGREELIRGVRLKNVSTRSLRDILGASGETAAFDYINNAAPFALMGVPGFLAATTVVAPGVLFEELEVDRIRDETVKPPVTPPPPLE